MSRPDTHLEVIVGDDGSLPAVGAEELARLGARPGEHLQLVRTAAGSTRQRKSVRGVLVGKVADQGALSEEDFAATHAANVEAADRRYGVLET